MNSSITEVTESREAGLRFAGTLFGVFAVLHVLRMIGRVDVVVARRRVPMLSSLVAATAGAALSAWLWKLSTDE